ncbi:MAG TPA: choice-of-anchor D domain-containing protein [Solirubrobacteraceae bacterium]|jgi:hypothetical protein
MRRAWFWYLVAAPLAALALLPAAAGAAVSDLQVHEAVERAVTWIRAEQEPDGSLGSNGGLDPAWSLLGLAGAGVNAADLSAGAGDSSAQSYYLSLWTNRSDSVWTSTGTPQASDYERVITLANAAGLDPLRLSSQQNLLAKLATFDHAGYFGSKGTFNQTMFALIALDQMPVPSWLVEQVAEIVEANAHEDGGYTFATVETQAAYEHKGEVDLTGAAIAGLCGAGRTTASPAVQKAIAFLEAIAGEGSLGDADSVSWALDGLGACGVKRGSNEWTAVDEHTVESLLSQQLPDGGWASSPAGDMSNFYATQDALRALDAPGFDVEPPTRLDPAEPVRRQPPSVAVGTTVPVVLAIDSGFGDIQLCSTAAPAGATLPEVLLAAQTHSEPAGCVAKLQVDAEGISSLDGAMPASGSGGWKLSLDDGSEQNAAGQNVGFGEVVGLRLEDPAPLGVSDSALAFAQQAVDGAGGTRELTLTNRLGVPVNVLSPRVGGADGGDYQVTAQTCVGVSLAAGASCAVTIAFTPSTSGERDALLEVATEGQGTVAIELHGEGSNSEPGGQQEQPGGPPTEQGSHQTSLEPDNSPQTKPGKPVKLRIKGLNAKRLLLQLGGSTRLEVRIELLSANPHHARPKHVKTITIAVHKAGEKKLALPHLAAGRYRVTVTTAGASVTRTLTIHAQTARQS